ncbi:MAG: allantoinase AllB, partial [Candidatus Methanomethylicota archaeon]
MKVVDLIISGCKVYFKGELVEASIAIDSGKIVKVGKECTMPPSIKKLSFPGKIAIPGVIDVHVHLRDQDLSYKETFETGTMAAAVGGVTTVLDMPNNKPVTDSAEALVKRMNLAVGRIYVNVGFYSAFPRELAEVKDIVSAGAVGFKLNLSRQIGSLDVDDDIAIKKAFLEVKKFGIPVSIHAEDRSIVSKFEEEFKNICVGDFSAFLRSHPPVAEVKAIERVVTIARDVGVKVHFAHVSTSDGLAVISKNKLYASCEVTPHHLYLTYNAIDKFGGFAVMEPPLRSEADVKALWNGLVSGVVDLIASDHAPHTIEEKSSTDVWRIRPGIPGLETMLPLMLTAFSNGRISLGKLVELMCEAPARIFNLKGKGRIEAGFDADIVIVDLDREQVIDPSSFKSKAKYSPFEGFKVVGVPIATFV